VLPHYLMLWARMMSWDESPVVTRCYG